MSRSVPVCREECTDGAYTFQVAGVGVRVQADVGIPLRIDGRRLVFVGACPDPEIDLHVRMQRLGLEPSGRLLFDSGMVWRLYEDSGEHTFRFSSPVLGPIPYKELRVTRDFRKGEIILHGPYVGSEPVDPLEYPLDELLVVNRLGQGLGCELHACGIIDGEGRGWLFCGHSGAGKSTLAKLWSSRRVTVLSDDRIVLREVDGEIRMFGTPWHGEAGFSVAEDAPLAGILVLGHAPRNEIESLARPEAVSELMARAFLPFFEAMALETAMDTLSTAASEAPCGRLGFVPDATAIACIEAWMERVDRG